MSILYYRMDLWPKDLGRARKIQELLSKKVKIVPLHSDPKYVCGLDAAYGRASVYGCASLFELPEIAPVEDCIGTAPLDFPYVPSFLGFREGRALIKAVKGLRRRPDVILFDGHGIAHPSFLGIASHIGVLLGIPSIGCAKENLVGAYMEPGQDEGSHSPIVHGERIVGVALRTRLRVRPIFVSPGHLVDLPCSIELILKCTKGYRLPEPIRRAHRLSKIYASKFEASPR